ncbi:tetratricopeptide repeat protein [Fodinibius sp. Rm-B-1B1-1]|uniref:tetratricopeptide repeat protein n=1 Tax=Fodinibius alkaliphilus TaxID=3140241 RepID=UPI00315A1C77
MNRSIYSSLRLAISLVALLLTIAPAPVWGQVQTIEEIEYTSAHTAYIDGLAAFENNDFEKALTLLNKAYVKLPEHAGVNYALADAYLQVNDIKNAEYYSKQARNIAPQNKWYHLQLINIYQHTGNTQGVIQALNSALTHHSKDTDILYNLAQAYADQGDYEKSNKIYHKLLQIQGEMISIRLERLKNFNNLGQKDSSIVELEKIRDQNPGNLATLHLLSNYYLDLDKPDEARNVIDNALDINPKDPKSLLALADIQLNQSQWDSAQTTLGILADDSTLAAETKEQLAQFVYTKFNKNTGNDTITTIASTVLKKLINHSSTSGKVHSIAADFFLKTDQKEPALRALKYATDLNPANDSAWQQYLQLLLEERQFEQVIQAGQKAIKEVPQDPVLLYFIGNAYLSTRQYDQAEAHLEEASTLPARKPLKANIFGSLADTYANMEQWSSAFTYYQKAVDLDPQNPVIFNNYAYYLSRRGIQLDKAEQLARKALAFSPDNTSFLDTVGWIYFKQGNLQKAKNYIERAINSGNPTAEVMEHMGDVLLKLGEPDEAKNWWQKALNKDSTRTHLREKLSD